MPSTLVLDRSDPGVNELVSNWADGETYQITLTIVQRNSSANAANYDVTGIEAEEVETEEPAEMPMKGGMMKGGMMKGPMRPPTATVEY